MEDWKSACDFSIWCEAKGFLKWQVAIRAFWGAGNRRRRPVARPGANGKASSHRAQPAVCRKQQVAGGQIAAAGSTLARGKWQGQMAVANGRCNGKWQF